MPLTQLVTRVKAMSVKTVIAKKGFCVARRIGERAPT